MKKLLFLNTKEFDAEMERGKKIAARVEKAKRAKYGLFVRKTKTWKGYRTDYISKSKRVLARVIENRRVIEKLGCYACRYKILWRVKYEHLNVVCPKCYPYVCNCKEKFVYERDFGGSWICPKCHPPLKGFLDHRLEWMVCGSKYKILDCHPTVHEIKVKYSFIYNLGSNLRVEPIPLNIRGETK